MIDSILHLLFLIPALFATLSRATPYVKGPAQQQESLQSDAQWNSNISHTLFHELEQLARIVDVAYCVGTSGITSPFICESHCSDFPNFELIDTFHSGYLLENSCGYIALDHGSGTNGGRILVVFRGTYSVPDTILDLSTAPQKYMPYPSPHKNEDSNLGSIFLSNLLNLSKKYCSLSVLRRLFRHQIDVRQGQQLHNISKCTNCTVHMGFWSSYQSVRPKIISHIGNLQQKYPNYRLNLVGHSLGGAVAVLSALELKSLGYDPTVTTFGEPRVGNAGLTDYIDTTFNLRSQSSTRRISSPNNEDRYRRVTHINDPVPLLPPQQLAYHSHAGEVFISKTNLPPATENMRHCFGDEDVNCIAGQGTKYPWNQLSDIRRNNDDWRDLLETGSGELKKRGRDRILPSSILQSFFAHRDYFWRLGLCIPGGDPTGRWRHEI